MLIVKCVAVLFQTLAIYIASLTENLLPARKTDSKLFRHDDGTKDKMEQLCSVFTEDKIQ